MNSFALSKDDHISSRPKYDRHVSFYTGYIDKDFLRIRFAKNSKKHSTNNKGKKKEGSHLSRLDFEFSYGHRQQLQEKESSKRLPESLLESGTELLISELCTRTGSVRHEIRSIRMRYLWSDFSAWKEPFSVGVYGEVFALFQACVGNFDTIPQSKVVGTLFLDSSYVNFKYFAFLSVCRLQNSTYSSISA